MGISSVISLAGGAGILGYAGYRLYLELENQKEKITHLTKTLHSLKETVKENDMIGKTHFLYGQRIFIFLKGHSLFF